MEVTEFQNYSHLIHQISETYLQGQKNAVSAVNSALVETYWQIGRYIIKYEQEGNVKAAYGKALLPNLSKDLTISFGKGFSLSNLKRMRQFYSVYPISAELPHQLSWTHFVELLKIDDLLNVLFIPHRQYLKIGVPQSLFARRSLHSFSDWRHPRIRKVY